MKIVAWLRRIRPWQGQERLDWLLHLSRRVATTANFAPIWKWMTASAKSNRLLLLQNMVVIDDAKDSLREDHLPFIVDPALLQTVLSLKWENSHKDFHWNMVSTHFDSEIWKLNKQPTNETLLTIWSFRATRIHLLLMHPSFWKAKCLYLLLMVLTGTFVECKSSSQYFSLHHTMPTQNG